jgi:hypothetical protein
MLLNLTPLQLQFLHQEARKELSEFIIASGLNHPFRRSLTPLACYCALTCWLVWVAWTRHLTRLSMEVHISLVLCMSCSLSGLIVVVVYAAAQDTYGMWVNPGAVLDRPLSSAWAPCRGARIFSVEFLGPFPFEGFGFPSSLGLLSTLVIGGWSELFIGSGR